MWCSGVVVVDAEVREAVFGHRSGELHLIPLALFTVLAGEASWAAIMIEWRTGIWVLEVSPFGLT